MDRNQPEISFSRFFHPGEDWCIGMARMCDFLVEKYRDTYR